MNLNFKTIIYRFIQYFFGGLDKQLLIILIMIIGLGLITLYSASIDMSNKIDGQIRNISFAFIIIWIISRAPSYLLLKAAIAIYTVGIALLIAVIMFGLTRKGAKRWINIGIILQPSEIMKIAVPLILAWYFQKRENVTKFLDYIVASAFILLPVALIAKQPDLGTALLVLASGIYIMFFAGLSARIVAAILLLVIISILLLLIFSETACTTKGDWFFLHDYQKHRICTLIDPNRDPLGKGFHTIQSIIAIGSGGLWGKGWLRGTQSHLEFIPEKHTDFIFAVYAEEFGLLGNILLLILFAALVIRGLAISLQAATLFERLLAGSITLIIFTYTFINMAMVSGLLPVVGIPLPLFSYGGTAIITQAVGLGILFNIARNKRLMQI